MKSRIILLILSLFISNASIANAVAIKLRPQGTELKKAVILAIEAISTKEIPFTLDTSSGVTLTIGGIGATNAPFNPDIIARTVIVGTEKRIEFNPKLSIPLEDAVRLELSKELGFKEWSISAAQLSYSGTDLNKDGKLDLADLAILMDNAASPEPKLGDFNQDGKVNSEDIEIFMAAYKEYLLAPKPPIPAPPAKKP